MPAYAEAATIPAARRIVEMVLAVKRGEKVCIVTDTERSERITSALLSASISVGADVVVVVTAPRDGRVSQRGER